MKKVWMFGVLAAALTLLSACMCFDKATDRSDRDDSSSRGRHSH